METSSDESSASSSGHNISFRNEKMVDMKEEPVSSRKIQKAEREKIRRGKLKKQLLELGDALEPTRPKSDKATILIDTIQILKDLMTQVDRLKAEYATLSQESREVLMTLNQEKSELREENSSLESDIKILSAQCQYEAMVPLIPHYTYPLPVVAVTQGPVSTLPFPLNGTQNPVPLPNPCTTSVPHLAASLSPKPEQKDDVGLELELKTPAASSLAQHGVSGNEKQ